MFDRKFVFFRKKGIHIVNLKKGKKDMYYFLFYIQYEFM